MVIELHLLNYTLQWPPKIHPPKNPVQNQESSILKIKNDHHPPSNYSSLIYSILWSYQGLIKVRLRLRVES